MKDKIYIHKRIKITENKENIKTNNKIAKIGGITGLVTFIIGSILMNK